MLPSFLCAHRTGCRYPKWCLVRSSAVFPIQLATMMVRQHCGAQRLLRMPEPRQVTDAASNVLQYDRVMKTKLVAAYAGGLAMLSRSLPGTATGTAADIACGPGLYTICLARYFEFARVLGIDLSAPMVKVAHKNAAAQGLESRVVFREGDATALCDLVNDSVDLASCTDALHHMPDLDTVTQVLGQMERVARPEGLVMAMDLVRLRTESLTEYYVKVLGSDYLERGLESFYDDFRNSMFAAWTADELFSAIPRDTDRWWCQLVPRGLPTVQVVLGLPIGRKNPFVRPAFGGGKNPIVQDWFETWAAEVSPKWANRTRSDCRIVQIGLATARKRFVPPAG